jgi:hypothetical protein
MATKLTVRSGGSAETVALVLKPVCAKLLGKAPHITKELDTAVRKTIGLVRDAPAEFRAHSDQRSAVEVSDLGVDMATLVELALSDMAFLQRAGYEVDPVHGLIVYLRVDTDGAAPLVQAESAGESGLASEAATDPAAAGQKKKRRGVNVLSKFARLQCASGACVLAVSVRARVCMRALDCACARLTDLCCFKHRCS